SLIAETYNYCKRCFCTTRGPCGTGGSPVLAFYKLGHAAQAARLCLQGSEASLAQPGFRSGTTKPTELKFPWVAGLESHLHQSNSAYSHAPQLIPVSNAAVFSHS